MSQQPGPYGQLPILLPVAGEPPIVKDRLPIEAISILYFRTLKAGHAVTQDMVVQLYIKANGVLISEGQTPPKCNIDAQSEVIQVANKSRKDFGWEWEPANVGRYIASGLWQYEDLDAATRPSDEIFQEVHKKHEVNLDFTYASLA